MKCFDFTHGELYFYLKGESMTLINEAAKDVAHYYGMEPEDFTMAETDYNDESVLPVEKEFKKGCWPTNSFTIFDCDCASNWWETQWPSWDNVPKDCPKMTINKETSLYEAVCWAIGMVSPTTPWYKGHEALGKAVVACLSDAIGYSFTKAEAEVIKEYVWHADTYEDRGLGETPLKDISRWHWRYVFRQEDSDVTNGSVCAYSDNPELLKEEEPQFDLNCTPESKGREIKYRTITLPKDDLSDYEEETLSYWSYASGSYKYLTRDVVKDFVWGQACWYNRAKEAWETREYLLTEV